MVNLAKKSILVILSLVDVLAARLTLDRISPNVLKIKGLLFY
jgi:hypothetical protein